MNVFKGEAEGNIRDLEHARSLPADDTIDSSPPRARTLTGGSLRSVRSQQSTPSPPGARRAFVRTPSLPSSPSLDSGDEKVKEETKEEEPVVAAIPSPARTSVSFREEDLEPYRHRMETMSPTLPKIPSVGEFEEKINMEEESGLHEADLFSFRPPLPDEETEDGGSKQNSFRSALQKVGDHLPEWMTDPIRNPPGWSRTAAFAVRYWPCFLCKPLETGATDRAILMRLNVICTFFSVGLVTAGTFMFLVLWWDRIAGRTVNIDDGKARGETDNFIPNLWNLNGNVIASGVVGAITLIVMLMARPIVRQVNLVGALRFMWVLLWILPVQLVFTIGLFDLHDATDVWVKQYWAAPSMAWFRKKFCRPSYTANSRCVVPIGGGAGFEDEDEWCMEFYGATDCTRIRDDAEARTDRFLSAFYYTVAAWGVFFIIYLILTVRILSAIITRPIVQASRESNVPAWLTLPIIGGFAAGFILAFSPSSVVSTQTGGQVWWIGVVYIIIGGLFAFAALLGWGLSVFAILNNRDKRNKSLLALLFILIMLLTVFAVSTLFIVSIVFSTNIASIPLKDSERGQFACAIDSGSSCTNCGNDEGLRECPEWSTEDVMAVVRTSLKLSATVAAIFWVYAVGALRFGILLRRHILMYQIAYV